MYFLSHEQHTHACVRMHCIHVHLRTFADSYFPPLDMMSDVLFVVSSRDTIRSICNPRPAGKMTDMQNRLDAAGATRLMITLANHQCACMCCRMCFELLFACI